MNRLGAALCAAVAAAVALGCSRTDPADYLTDGSFLFEDGGSGGSSGGGPTDGERGDARARRDRDGSGSSGDGSSDVRAADHDRADRDEDRDVEPRDARRDVSEHGCKRDSQCDDGISCTIDRCDVSTGTCTHTPDDAKCTTGDSCFPSSGCAPGSFAVSVGSNLYQAFLPEPLVSLVGPISGIEKFNDIALRSDAVLFGVTDGALYTIDTTTTVSTLVAPVAFALQSLEFGPDGTLYGAGANAFYTIDTTTGALAAVCDFPVGYDSSGDVAVIGTILYGSATDGKTDGGMEVPDVLVSVDLTSPVPTAVIVGSTGYPCIWGLAYHEGVLFGFTCEGYVLSLDPTTGAGTVLGHPGDTFIGATSQ